MSDEAGREIEEALDIQGLRKGLLCHTRKAYGLLPQREWPLVLDIGCGRGEVTLELARLTSGHIIGIDIDDSAFGNLRLALEREGLVGRVTFERCSLFNTNFPAHSFDLLWEEGVLHTLDASRSIRACSHLLKRSGFLVSGETVGWLADARKYFEASGFELAERHLWPASSWWFDYYAPLEERIRRLREKHGDSRGLGALRRYENEIRMVRSDPKKFDCAHFLFQMMR